MRALLHASDQIVGQTSRSVSIALRAAKSDESLAFSNAGLLACEGERSSPVLDIQAFDPVGMALRAAKIHESPLAATRIFNNLRRAFDPAADVHVGLFLCGGGLIRLREKAGPGGPAQTWTSAPQDFYHGLLVLLGHKKNILV